MKWQHRVVHEQPGLVAHSMVAVAVTLAAEIQVHHAWSSEGTQEKDYLFDQNL